VAVAAKKKKLYKGCYTQRDSGKFGPHLKSGHGLHYGSHHGFWESKGTYEDENTIVIIYL